MCGIAGVLTRERGANQPLYDALTVLQHRGQDAAGIVTCENANRLHLRKGSGLVRDVFTEADMLRLRGDMGIAHCRYPTAGCCSGAEAQPFYVNSPYGITLAHNGNLTNAAPLVRALFRSDLRHVNTGSDSEVLLNVLAHELVELGQLRPRPQDVFTAVEKLHQRCRGAYAFVAMLTGYGLLGVRDPHGIRPLVFGSRESARGVEYMIASESVALDTQGFELIRDVAPGEAVYVTPDGKLHTRLCAEPTEFTPCIFEHVYLARPDSVIDDISVYKARLRMGEKLAEKVLRQTPDHDIDAVIPIPDSGRTCGFAMAQALGVKYREGFIKNRYIGRTFIMPGQDERRASVRKKLNPIGLEFQGKTVCLVDDSLVRGTTSQQIVELARKAGAKKVYFCSAAPAVRFPNVYGIDMPAAKELIAHDRSDEEVAKLIGADRLIYQDLSDLVETCREGNPKIERFEDSIFTGRYVTGDVDASYLHDLELARGEAVRQGNEPLAAEEQDLVFNREG